MTTPALESVSFIVGARFGRWTVVGEPVQRARYQKYVRCRCACGRERDVWCPDLRIGGSTQCRSCAIGKRSTKHGCAARGKKTPEYIVWKHMVERCGNPRLREWPYYGGRGIRVTVEWTGEGGFERFLLAVGPRPSLDYSIDRIDNDGHYEPGNVRWADRTTQMRNRRMAVLVTHEGKTACVAEWAEFKGIKPATLGWRIRNGWSVERALTP